MSIHALIAKPVSANSVMQVLRENKDSVMAVLEAFVCDPLLNWRLIDGEWGSQHL